MRDSYLASEQLAKPATVVVSRKQLQTTLRGNLINLLGNKAFSEWPESNIDKYDSGNPKHLMQWAAKIVKQDQKALFTAKQTTERQAFESLTQDEKVGQIIEALRGEL